MNYNSTFKGKFVISKETFESHIIHSNNVHVGQEVGQGY